MSGTLTEGVGGYTLWPGGNLLSGNITDGGATATGSVTTWAPAFPTTAAQIAAETTAIDLQSLPGANALRIIGFMTGTPSDATFTLDVNIWLAFYTPVNGATTPGAIYLPSVTQLTWASDSGGHKTVTADVGPLPNGAQALNAATSSITNYFRPFAYPLDNIPRDGANIAIAGYARDIVVTPAASNLYMSEYCLPIGGAAKAAYRVNSCISTGAGVTSVGFRMLYMLYRQP